MFLHNILVRMRGILSLKTNAPPSTVPCIVSSVLYCKFPLPLVLRNYSGLLQRGIILWKRFLRKTVLVSFFHVCVSYEAHGKNASFIITVNNRMYAFRIVFTSFTHFTHFLYLLAKRVRSLPRRHWLNSIKIFHLFSLTIK